MSVAAPVLERKTDTNEREFERDYSQSVMTDEQRHNSLISENYAKLINPESKLKDIIVKRDREEERDETASGVYLVRNARADADIFRADSALNRRVAIRSAVTVQGDEEENEDLRPTQTTIQYRTSEVKKTVEEGKIGIRQESKKLSLTKKDKIIIAVALSVIVALFVLIIVNSAVISNLNSEVSALQNTLTETQNVYVETNAAKQAYLEEDNIREVVKDFAEENGMISARN